MRLRRIDIVGFKSFRDKMSLEFSEGMTAIVGPNGCGKSNVVDAMKWAMGDMSPKSLRGQSMEDVIFAGSESARPLGMAEVTLTFENDGSAQWDDSIPREFREISEIAVTRRLHRSGDSEYLINKVGCRLMDIQNLLAGTGVGKQGYSIIEQNQVGFIVSARPSERRLLIEEASGITRYKAQRERTVKRLEKAEENLQRSEDVLLEVTRQIRSLERQAQRAAQHRRLSEELFGLELALLTRRYDALHEREGRERERLAAAKNELEEAVERLERHEKALGDLRDAVQISERHLSDAREAFFKLETRNSLAQTNLSHATTSLRDVQERLSNARHEASSQADRAARLKRELEGVERELAELDQGSRVDSQVNEEEKELRELRDALVRTETDAQEVKAALERVRSEFHRAQDRVAWLKSQLEEMAGREAEINEVIKSSSVQMDRWSKRVDEELNALEALEEQVAKGKVNLDGLRVAKTELESRCLALRREHEKARGELLSTQARLDSMKSIRASGEGFAGSVQDVMKWASREGENEVLGPLGNFLDVPAHLESAVARWLGPRLEHIIVRSREVAFRAAQRRIKGRIVFEVWSDFDGPTFSETLVSSFESLAADSGLPPKEQKVFVFESGVLVADELVVAGEALPAGAEALRRANQIKELESTVVAMDSGEKEALKALEIAQAEREETWGKWDEARRSLESAELGAREQSRKIEEFRREVTRSKAEIDRSRSQLLPMLRRREQCQEELEDLQGRESQNVATREELAQQFAARESEVKELRRAVETLHLSLTEKRVEQAKARERRRSLEESFERIRRGIQSAVSLEERYVNERKELEKKSAEFEVIIKDSNQGLAQMSGELEQAKATVEIRTKEASEAQNRSREAELMLREKRAQTEKAREALMVGEGALREVQIEIEHTNEKLKERFDGNWQEARVIAAQVELPEGEQESRRDYLRRRLEQMGPVNAMAEEEYEEAQGREVFLTEQRDDLLRSVSDLRKAIAEMDRESRKRFRETFDAVDAQFREIFPKLFRGGHARLILTDPNDMLTTGVDIEVCPPGKRLQNVTLLSGGEKALTAVSLIFSIFMLKPTPFSILDEVDAPLDEANVGRFAEMVRQMSEMSQMIVITHSRRTMEAAQMLYGVTMEDAGISKIVSVKLSDAEELVS